MKISEYIRKRKAVRDLSQAIYGTSLNSIGALYDCQRIKGESNRRFRRRVLRAAMKSDYIFVYGEGRLDVTISEDSKPEQAEAKIVQHETEL